MKSKRILVVGGGVIGRCTAYYAARRGHRVALLDRNPAEYPGCSFGNAGFITPSHFIPLAAPGMVALGLKWMLNPESPFYVRPRLDRELLSWAWRFHRAANPVRVARAAPVLLQLNLASRTAFEELAGITGNSFSLVKRGCLMLCRTTSRLEEEIHVAEEGKKLGLTVDILDAAGIGRLEPGIRINAIGAVHFRDDAHFIPDRFMTAMLRLLEEQKVECLWQTEVTGWRVRGNVIEAATTTRGEMEADEFVLAGGSWTPGLGRTLNVRLPMQAGKGYSLTLPQPGQRPAIAAICTEARLAVTPMGDSLRFGGTMEISGHNEEINPARIRGILKSVSRYYPDFTAEDFKDVQPWCGLRPLSPDGLPYVGRFRNYRNLSVGTGHAMLGMSLGPVTGQLLAGILSDEPTSVDMGLLSPDRYSR